MIEAVRANGKLRETSVAIVRVAIYTRKSVSEGLDQEFNSLDAQRSARGVARSFPPPLRSVNPARTAGRQHGCYACKAMP